MLAHSRCAHEHTLALSHTHTHTHSHTNTHRYDPDELDEEQRERKLRKKLNELFKRFTEKVQDAAESDPSRKSRLDFDTGFKKMAFKGVTKNSMETIYPATECLFEITQNPAIVVTLDEIEHVHFERAMLGTKDFDFSIIFKDSCRTPTVSGPGSLPPRPVLRISSIPQVNLEVLIEWFTEIGITFTAGNVNMNWSAFFLFYNII